MKFTVEEGRSLQGNAYLMKDLFQEYNFLPPGRDGDGGGSSSSSSSAAAAAASGRASGDDDGEDENPPSYCFRINFSVMWECLAMFMSSVAYTAVQIAYGGYGSALFLLLEEGNLSTRCSIRTLDNAEHMPVIPMTDTVAEVILDSELLKDAFAELDWSSDTARLLLSPEPPNFQLSTEGRPGKCEVEYPMNNQLFRKFKCKRTVTAAYKMSILQPTVKALAMAQLTQLQMNPRGQLKMQHMIQTEDKKTSFVDFNLMPEENGMDDDDDDDGGSGFMGSTSTSSKRKKDFVAHSVALMDQGLLDTPDDQPAMTDASSAAGAGMATGAATAAEGTSSLSTPLGAGGRRD